MIDCVINQSMQVQTLHISHDITSAKGSLTAAPVTQVLGVVCPFVTSEIPHQSCKMLLVYRLDRLTQQRVVLNSIHLLVPSVIDDAHPTCWRSTCLGARLRGT